jgi:adhesin transport system outer membrane protein
MTLLKPFLIGAALSVSLAAVAPLGAETKAVYGPPADPAKGDTVAIAVVDTPPGVPPALVRAAAIATENYPSIRTAEAEVRAARSDLKSARWLRFPNLSVEALAVSKGSDNTQSGVTANLVLEQPLLAFGRISGTIDRAQAAWIASRAQVDETARNVALQVTDSFYNVALAARQQTSLEDSLAQHRSLLQTMQNRVRQEVSPQADLDLAMSRTAQVEQDLESVKAQRAVNLSQLIQLVGTASVDLGNVPEYDPATMHPSEEGAIDRALACDPQLARLRAEVAVAEAEAKVTKAGIFPQVLGQLSHNEITGSRAGVVLRAQSGNGLSVLAAAESARARVQAAEFNISTAERDIRQAVQLDFVNNRSSRERAAAGAQAALTSGLVTESYKRQFITGRRTWLDVMNAVREDQNNKLQVASAEIAAMASNAHIWLRTCGWQPRPLDTGSVETKK